MIDIFTIFFFWSVYFCFSHFYAWILFALICQYWSMHHFASLYFCLPFFTTLLSYLIVFIVGIFFFSNQFPVIFLFCIRDNCLMVSIFITICCRMIILDNDCTWFFYLPILICQVFSPFQISHLYFLLKSTLLLRSSKFLVIRHVKLAKRVTKVKFEQFRVYTGSLRMSKRFKDICLKGIN